MREREAQKEKREREAEKENRERIRHKRERERPHYEIDLLMIINIGTDNI